MEKERLIRITMTEAEFENLKNILDHGDELANALIEKERRSIYERVALSEGWSDLIEQIRGVIDDE